MKRVTFVFIGTVALFMVVFSSQNSGLPQRKTVGAIIEGATANRAAASPQFPSFPSLPSLPSLPPLPSLPSLAALPSTPSPPSSLPSFSSFSSLPSHPPEENARYALIDRSRALPANKVPAAIANIKETAASLQALWPKEWLGEGDSYVQYINYQLPTWFCPFEERVAGLDDGGKWICSPRTLLYSGAPCYVYSFGSNLQFEFEESLSAIRHCETHIFDPTPSLRSKLASVKLPPHFHFHQRAFGGAVNRKATIENVQFDTNTLDEIRTELKTPHIDILKIDVETSEWNQIFNRSKDSIWNQAKIGQLLIEIHLPGPNKQFGSMVSLFQQLTQAGFILFHSEINIFAPTCWEFSFIQPDYRPSPTFPTNMERILMQPYTPNEVQATRLSDLAWQSHFFSYYDNKWPGMTFNWLEATIHCVNKHFIGDRRDLSRDFMYLCFDFQTSDSSSSSSLVYTSVTASTDAPSTRSSVERALNKRVDPKFVVNQHLSTGKDRDGYLADVARALKTSDIVRIDFATEASTHALVQTPTAREFDAMLGDSIAKIVVVELHLCLNAGGLLEKRQKKDVIQWQKLWRIYGYEIYHKELMFAENHRNPKLGQFCNSQISFMRLAGRVGG